MSFYGDVDLEEPSDCEGGTDSSDDDGLNALMNSRSRPALRRRHRSSSRGSSSSRSRSRSRSLSRSRLTAANTAANAATNSSTGVGRLHLLEDSLVSRDDVDRLVADSQRLSADSLLPGGASRKLIVAASGASKSAVAVESLEDEAEDFERMMEEELDQVVVEHVEEQKRRWMLDRGGGRVGKRGGAGSSEDVDMEVEDSTLPTSRTLSTTDSGSKPSSKASSSLPSVAQEFYDDIYFDSDDNEETGVIDDDADDKNDDKNLANSNHSQLPSATNEIAESHVDRIQKTVEENEQKMKYDKKKNKKKHPVLTNDELFYDPNMDDEDQKWVDERRRKNFFPSEKGKSGSTDEKTKEEVRKSGSDVNSGNTTAAATSNEGAASRSNRDAEMKDAAEKGSAGNDSTDASKTDASVKSKKKKKREEAKLKRLPNSDATLSCPGCITTLTMDCQKHEIYAHQYRAMFVSNCIVDTREVLTYPKDNKKKGRKDKKGAMQSDVPSSSFPSSIDSVLGEDQFYSVRCAECDTQVAVYDKDEIYYFFNVLASH